MNHPPCTMYEIRFRGNLHPRWSDWFDGFTLITFENGECILRGSVRDQSELRGVLEKIANLNLYLISVNPVKTGFPSEEEEQTSI